MCCLFLSRTGNVNASAQKSRIQIKMQEITYKHNGGTIDLIKEEPGKYSVLFDTTGENEGYYTTYLYVEQEETIEDKSVVSFHMETKQSVCINVDIVHEPDHQSYKCEDGSPVFIKREGKKQYKGIPVEYGTFQIPENFKGTVYIPIEANGQELHSFGIGIVAVLSQNEKAEFTMSSMEVSKGYELQDNIFYSDILWKGPASVQIPVHGQYYYDYFVNQNGKKAERAKFFLEKPVEGITLEQNGKLVIADTAQAQKMNLLVEVNQILQCQFEVDIVKSWIEVVDGVDVSSFVVPEITEVEPVDAFIVIPYYLIRGLVLVSGGVFLVFYQLKIKRKR